MTRRTALAVAGTSIVGAMAPTVLADPVDGSSRKQLEEPRDLDSTPVVCLLVNDTTLEIYSPAVPRERQGFRVRFAMWADGMMIWAVNWQDPGAAMNIANAGPDVASRLLKELDSIGVFDPMASAIMLAVSKQSQLRCRSLQNRVIHQWHEQLAPGYPDEYSQESFRKFVNMWYSSVRAICATARGGVPLEGHVDRDGAFRGYNPTDRLKCWWLYDRAAWKP